MQALARPQTATILCPAPSPRSCVRRDNRVIPGRGNARRSRYALPTRAAATVRPSRNATATAPGQCSNNALPQRSVIPIEAVCARTPNVAMSAAARISRAATHVTRRIARSPETASKPSATGSAAVPKPWFAPTLVRPATPGVAFAKRRHPRPSAATVAAMAGRRLIHAPRTATTLCPQR